MMGQLGNSHRRLIVLLLLTITSTASAVIAGGCRGESAAEPLVVYCAHDRLFSERILQDFERQTGIDVEIRFDTEATKSLGLVNLILREKENPRCDVFWNNQVLGTSALKESGLLTPYKGPGYERIPVRYKDPGGYWTGFAARLRVVIVNTDKMAADDDAIRHAMDGDLSRMAMANPMFGTTLSHYSVLWRELGKERLIDWHFDLRQRGLIEVAGNATVKNLVAAGTCDFGWTDTDDFYVAVDDGLPVAMRPIRLDTGETTCIPNSVAIVKGTDKLAVAQKLVDFLLSAETELKLSNSQSRQIPLGAVDEDQLTDEVRRLREWKDAGYDLNRVGSARTECLDWLKSETL